MNAIRPALIATAIYIALVGCQNAGQGSANRPLTGPMASRMPESTYKGTYQASGVKSVQTIPTEEELKQQLQPMTIEEMRLDLIGNTLIWKSLETGKEYPIYYDGDGIRRMNLESQTQTTRWWFGERQLCSESFTDGSEVCADHYRDEGFYWSCAPRDGGQCHWIFIVEKGNSRNL